MIFFKNDLGKYIHHNFHATKQIIVVAQPSMAQIETEENPCNGEH